MKLEKAPVSVVVPCHRCAETIERAVDSILNQTLPPEEILLVEDGSGDNGATLSALRNLQQLHPDSGIRIIEMNKNCGPAAARNAGWEAATRPHVAFLDADDAWHPEKIGIQYSWMNAHPEVPFSGHRIKIVSSASEIRPPIGLISARKISPWQWLLSCRFSTISVMLRRDLPLRFAPEKRHAEDYLLWLQIALNGYETWRIESTLGFCFKPLYGAGGLSGELWKAEKGVLDTYSRIRHDGLISQASYLGLTAFSLLKYARRLILNLVKGGIPK